MNNIIRFFAIICAGFVAACATSQGPAHTPASNDPFRINMANAPLYSGTTPTSTCPAPGPPVCADNGGVWWDVSNWQYFLNTHGASPQLTLTNDFNMLTQTATATWQGKNGLMATGKVDQATYNKATTVALNPMPKYPTRPPN